MPQCAKKPVVLKCYYFGLFYNTKNIYIFHHVYKKIYKTTYLLFEND